MDMGYRFLAGSRFHNNKGKFRLTGELKRRLRPILSDLTSRDIAPMPFHFLIIEAGFYQDLALAQRAGAVQALEAEGVSYDIISVPGALEIPAALKTAHLSETHFDGYVALGCVIRGQTSHYDTVCSESARGLMDLSIQHDLAIGNGILTVENTEQAWERADKDKLNKGGGAALAALAMARLKADFTSQLLSAGTS